MPGEGRPLLSACAAAVNRQDTAEIQQHRNGANEASSGEKHDFIWESLPLFALLLVCSGIYTPVHWNPRMKLVHALYFGALVVLALFSSIVLALSQSEGADNTNASAAVRFSYASAGLLGSDLLWLAGFILARIGFQEKNLCHLSRMFADLEKMCSKPMLSRSARIWFASTFSVAFVVLASIQLALVIHYNGERSKSVTTAEHTVADVFSFASSATNRAVRVLGTVTLILCGITVQGGGTTTYFYSCIAVFRGMRELRQRIEHRSITPAAAHKLHDHLLNMCEILSETYGRWLGLMLLSSAFDIIARLTLLLVNQSDTTAAIREQAYVTVALNAFAVLLFLLPTGALHWAAIYLPDTARQTFVKELEESENAAKEDDRSNDWYRLYETCRSEHSADMLSIRMVGVPITVGFLAGVFSAAVSLAGAMLQQASGKGA